MVGTTTDFLRWSKDTWTRIHVLNACICAATNFQIKPSKLGDLFIKARNKTKKQQQIPTSTPLDCSCEQEWSKWRGQICHDLQTTCHNYGIMYPHTYWFMTPYHQSLEGLQQIGKANTQSCKCLRLLHILFVCVPLGMKGVQWLTSGLTSLLPKLAGVANGHILVRG